MSVIAVNKSDDGFGKWPSLFYRPFNSTRRYMKKLSVLPIGSLVLLALTLPLLAQAPYAAPNVHTNVIVRDALHPATPCCILPEQFRAAYGFNQIPNLGAGMTIALIDAYKDPNIESDVAFYANYFHKTPCNLSVVIIGNPVEGEGWDLEESLDTQQACALAPQANIILFEATTQSLADLLAAVQMASQAPYNASVISMSFGYPDAASYVNDNSYFCNIVNGNGQPVTFVAATGDSGHGTIYPSTSPCVVAAGGTSLVLSSAEPGPNPLSLDYGSETVWNDPYGATGGGISRYESETSWQVTACAPFSPAGFRCVPDIASNAGVVTGVPVYDTFSYGGWVQVGGTSVATPDWASFFTLVNSQRVTNGGTTLSTAAEDLYTLYYNSTDYATDFHDITVGNNGGCGLDCDAQVGYDLETGIGTYQAQNLWAALVADSN